MKLAYFPNQIALNGQLTLRSFLNGAKKHNFTLVENSLDADAAVIWSVLWNGRLQANKIVYDTYRSQGKPVFILEVGSLRRGYTWKLALNHITNQGIYGNIDNLDSTRPGKIGISLQSSKLSRKNHILVACQHQKSLQWQGQPSIEQWLDQIIKNIRQYTARPIIIRPHPRAKFSYLSKEATISNPIKISIHEEYDISYDCHCVVNHNSGPSVISAIQGTPVICDATSLANEVSTNIENIESAELPDRNLWFLKMCHTEWTNEELNQGTPISRLLPYIKS